VHVWRGPQVPGEFPTLGYAVGQWIEEYCVIPDGPQRGTPYLLTREMWEHLLHTYRLNPLARVHPRYPRPADGLVNYGTQLRRPQKWGKDPLNAAKCCAHAFGPVQFDGWDADGEPVGRPVDTPWVQILATSEDQTGNTFRPVYRMLSEGPLADLPGLDIGLTAVKLPEGDGWIEPVSTSATSRLGNPISYASFTETHLMTLRNGGLATVRAMKRNLAGMGGTWGEVTNAWDPSQGSAAQEQAEAKARRVYLDHRAADLPNLTKAEFADDEIVRERIVIKYGDSARIAGGWVDEEGILDSIRDGMTGEGESRRFYLDELTIGERDAVDAVRWDALARPVAVFGDLEPGEAVALGFDGSRVLDSTSLIACRISDGRWFRLGLWSPEDYATAEMLAAKIQPKIPEHVVEQALDDAFAAYTVWHMFADPYRWQTVLDRKAGEWGNNPQGKPVLVELPTNTERRIDPVIDLWETACRSGEGEFTHDGSRDLRQHALNAALSPGTRKPEREEQVAGVRRTHYMRVVKKHAGWRIDAFVAGLLATAARARAIEEGALSQPEPEQSWAFTTGGGRGR